MFKTKREGEAKIREVCTWIAAGLLGLGLAFYLTVIFMPLGMYFIIAGALVQVVGWLVCWLVPRFFRYHTMYCPKCKELNRVRRGVVEYHCGGCDYLLHGSGFWQQGKKSITKKAHLKREA